MPSRARPSCSTGRRIITPASTIRRSASTRRRMLFMRGAGPIGYPGAAEVVNMRAPDYLIKRGIKALPCIGDGRQSGTSGSPSILNASPEAAAGGGLALLQDRRPGAHRPRQGHGRHPAAGRGTGSSAARISKRPAASSIPDHQTPWQEIQRRMVGQMESGAVLEPAVQVPAHRADQGHSARQPLSHRGARTCATSAPGCRHPRYARRDFCMRDSAFADKPRRSAGSKPGTEAWDCSRR